MAVTKVRPFLKWPGGKYKCMNHLLEHLPQGKKLVEPFVGAGSVFLNTDYEAYKLCDINSDLILLFNSLKSEPKEFSKYAHSFFTKKNNTEKNFYKLRAQFNATKDPMLRAALFLYLNRHCYNGLVRYNGGKGEFNSPFGRYKKPYFPETEMKAFAQKAKRAQFICQDYNESLKNLTKHAVVYCDPPYVPLSETAYFTSYSGNNFGVNEQEQLAKLAERLQQRDIKVLISNHATKYTKELYAGARQIEIEVPRYISCKSTKRNAAKELIAIYE